MNPPLTTENTEASIFGRAIDPANWKLSAEVARSVLEIKLPRQDRERMDELALKAQAGTLSQDEEVELENYRQVGCLVELMKSKARIYLKSVGADGS